MNLTYKRGLKVEEYDGLDDPWWYTDKNFYYSRIYSKGPQESIKTLKMLKSESNCK